MKTPRCTSTARVSPRARGYNQTYAFLAPDAPARALLRPGVNLLAVHVRNTRGARYFDAGIVEVIE
jgi:hypothetical protein